MLFVTVWELNENNPIGGNVAGAQRLLERGLFPPAGVEILRWDATPDGWGVLTVEAESAGAMEATLTLWRAAVPGFFARTKTAPASPVQETVGRTAALLQKLGAA